VKLSQSADSKFSIHYAIGVAFVSIIFSLALFGVYFETHDDSLMSLIAAGALGSSGPSPDLWYSHRLLGLLLSSCYRLFPNVNWYLGFQLSVQVASQAVWLWLFQRVTPGPRGWWCFAIWFVVVGWLWLIPLQFTTLACVAFTAGMALIVFDATQDQPTNYMGLFNPCFLTGVGFLLVSHLIRHASFQLGCLMAVPVVGLLAYSWPRQTTIVQTIRGVLVVGIILISNRGEAWYYNSQPEWKDYRQSWLPIALLANPDRLQFTPSNPRFAAREEQQAHLRKLRQIGWTPHDMVMLRGGFVDDRTVFSAERKAEAVRVLFPPTTVDRGRFWSFLLGAPFYWLQKPIVLTAILIASLVGWRFGLSRRFLVAIIASVLWFFVLSAYLKAYEKLPYRVLRIIALAPLLTIFTAIVGTKRTSLDKLFSIRTIDWAIAAVSLALTCWLLQDSMSIGQRRGNDFSRLQQDLKNAPISSENHYVMYKLEILGVPPLADTSMFKGWSWIFLDCLADHPQYREQIRKWGWRDASEGLRTDPDARLISDDIYAHELQKFFDEHYPHYRLKKEWNGEEISIYRVVRLVASP
jgi:hypothetical protein